MKCKNQGRGLELKNTILKMKQTGIILGFLLIISANLFGTSQVPDFLIVESDTLPINANPLETYFYNQGERFIEDVCTFDKTSTNCWRGYIGYWTLENDSLFLTNIEHCCYNDSVRFLDLFHYFKDDFVNDKVFAGWVSLKMSSPFGKVLNYIHFGYASIYEKEKIFIFNNGILEKFEILECVKESEFSQNIELYTDFMIRNIDWVKIGFIPKDSCFVTVDIKTDEFGKPKDPEIRWGNKNEVLNEEAKRIALLIPMWKRAYRMGEFASNIEWMIPIIFYNEKEYLVKNYKEYFEAMENFYNQ